MKHAADGLDPEVTRVLVNELDQFVVGRSSSAAKNVDAFFSVLFARRASASSFRSRRFSFSSDSLKLRSGVEQAYMNQFPHTSSQQVLFKGKAMATGNVNVGTHSASALAEGQKYLISRHGSLSNLNSHVANVGAGVLRRNT